MLTDPRTFYTLGKCLSKMHNCGVDVRGPVKQIDHQLVINAFVRAIELVPEKRDSRHPEKDPILEPHYKLVSVVHKLVQSKRLSVRELSLLLSVRLTPNARLRKPAGLCKPHPILVKCPTSKTPRTGRDIFCKFSKH